MAKAIIDTDVASFLIKGDSRAELYSAALTTADLYMSFQTVAELYQWAETHNWGATRVQNLADWLMQYGGYDGAIS